MSTNVLVVDDSLTVREEVMQALSGLNVDIKQAVDGIEALRVIQNNDIDCVICDVNMPRMNGIDVVVEVRKQERFAELPILMLTTEGSRELILKARRAGASGWMVKPFVHDMLARTVTKMTRDKAEAQ